MGFLCYEKQMVSRPCFEMLNIFHLGVVHTNKELATLPLPPSQAHGHLLAL